MKKEINIEFGLTEEEVEKSRKENGNNEIVEGKKTTFFSKFLESLGDPIIRILLIALGIRVLFLMQDFDWYETVGIVIAIFVASFISTISEYGSEKSFVKLQQEASKIKCRVKRNGKLEEIKVEDVVVGDIVLLSAGDKIPADGILMKGNISVDESSLNGEAKEVYKEPQKNILEDKNKLYRGTVVYSKEGVMLVTDVGSSTMYGKLALELAESTGDSPLKLRLAALAKTISKIGYIGAILVSLSYLFSTVVIQNGFSFPKIIEDITNFRLMLGHVLYALTLCVTVIVVAVPEGLPMMITLVLSSNMKRMLKNNVLVRKLVGIETAGSLNILFTDKTGTLTKGKLEVVGYVAPSLKEFYTEIEIKKYARLYDYVKNSLLYNNECTYSGGKYIGGNITDRALLQFITTDKSLKYKKIKENPFDSKNKYSYTVADIAGNKKLIKGAPEKIIDACNEYYDDFGMKRRFLDKEKIKMQIKNYTKKGIRVLALSIDEMHTTTDDIQGACFLGLILMKDEVRKEAITGVDLVKNAHIQVVMITGDNKDTATSIAKETHIIESESDLILTSDELKQMTDDKIKEILPHLRVLARALPLDKSRLVRLAKEMDMVVGMTGDGVNDAPALKKADVGFAMGSGTEVSKEASDIVILDDNFLSIAKAILFGRTIFKSIRKFIIVQLSINFCALSLSIIGPFIGIDTPVTVVQMLWINMVMDTLAGLAFAFEPPMLEYMKEKPKKKTESIINTYMLSSIVWTSLYSAILCFFFLKAPILRNIYQSDARLMTAFFGLFIFIDVFNSFNARTSRINIVAGILKNKVFLSIIGFIIFVQILLIYFGGSVFRTTGLTFFELQFMILLALTVIPADWARKYLLKKMHQEVGV